MKSKIPNISIQDYSYNLPEEKIALQPLSVRSDAKMLVYQNQNIQDDKFCHLPKYFETPHFFVLNETKVIHARLLFTKASGATIEIFCLQAAPIYPDITTALAQKGAVQWICIIGNRKRWKDTQQALQLQLENGLTLEAKINKEDEKGTWIQFEWTDTEMSFAEVLQIAGKVPLPPYIKRALNKTDEERYQTVFAQLEGSVAAPTASLHLTQEVLNTLQLQGHTLAKTCLHVGAGTFMPVKDDNVSRHIMHEEWIKIDLTFLKQWRQFIRNQNPAKTVAVGTTACRTLESIYWIGVKILEGKNIDWKGTALHQWECYDLPQKYELEEVLQAWIDWLEPQQKTDIQTKTQLIILPGYAFKSVQVLVTNFHQPASTLLLLVAAFCGDNYKNIYQYALDHDYRFLSYGDGSVLFND